MERAKKLQCLVVNTPPEDPELMDFVPHEITIINHQKNILLSPVFPIYVDVKTPQKYCKISLNSRTHHHFSILSYI